MVGVAFPRGDRVLIGPVANGDADILMSAIDAEEAGLTGRELEHALGGLVVPVVGLRVAVGHEDHRVVRRLRGLRELHGDIVLARLDPANLGYVLSGFSATIDREASCVCSLPARRGWPEDERLPDSWPRATRARVSPERLRRRRCSRRSARARYV